MDKETKKALVFKTGLLEKAKETLKQEFIGLDKIIDQLVSYISSWYLFPQLQERPLIINLWGMTGVGKSALVKRLIELIQFENIRYYFDLGEVKGDKLNIFNQLRDLSNVSADQPSVIVFDEFQLARTISETNEELIEPNNRIIWKLLDVGKFEIDNASQFKLLKLSEEITTIEFLIKKGVRAKNGKVTEQLAFFQKVHNQNQPDRYAKEDDEKLMNDLLIHPSTYLEIWNCRLMGFRDPFEIEEYLLSLNEMETLAFLKRVLNEYTTPTTIDCSKALIFNIGNLNSLYPMSSNYSIDLSADEFYKQSLKIDLSDVKKKLSGLFRHEQVARLGNNHIIYPSINETQYLQFIEKKLELLSKTIKSATGFRLTFEDTFKSYLYNLAVIPSLGYRPVLSSIDTEVQAHLGKMVQTVLKQKLDIDEVCFWINNDQIIGTFKKADEKIYSLLLKMNPTRKIDKRNDADIITSLHESGHILVSLMLEGKVPEQVVCKSRDQQLLGFVYYTKEDEILNRKNLRAKLAGYLGGRAAEEIVFGKEYITSGAYQDLKEATKLASKAIKVYGLGQHIGSYSNAQPNDQEIQYQGLESQIQHEIDEAYALALETLRNNKKWLKKLSMKLLLLQKVNQTQLLKVFEEIGIKPKDYESTFNYTWEFMRMKT
ncbi:hypothetical protein OB69_02250 [Roseivirga seohaensis subsp. aquiponti]|uniref:Peptidase M41 domain-containing protein n=1 Tax=Roseivirga seohaensis subsp. aquiponti TaxID=1566026 RepID=A0A0L8AQ36_9BACT|nr:hypothetical protein [Roseivirga seohaensis]KOF04355.1 hypothetical protein OB69_02250 [Roseivirga seohaensis subsp. aquiponti]